jgi:hypothetical protein
MVWPQGLMLTSRPSTTWASPSPFIQLLTWLVFPLKIDYFHISKPLAFSIFIVGGGGDGDSGVCMCEYVPVCMCLCKCVCMFVSALCICVSISGVCVCVCLCVTLWMCLKRKTWCWTATVSIARQLRYLPPEKYTISLLTPSLDCMLLIPSTIRGAKQNLLFSTTHFNRKDHQE